MLPKFMEKMNKMTSSMQLSSSFSSTGQDAIVNRLKQINMFKGLVKNLFAHGNQCALSNGPLVLMQY